MNFTYRLLGVGWVEAELGGDGINSVFPVSYLSEPLADLLSALADLLEGATDARCSWFEEPGEFRWIFERRGDRLALRVLWFEDDLYPPEEDDSGRLRVRGEHELRPLAAVVANAAKALLDKHGPAGYEELWRSPFPYEALERITRNLEQ